MLELRPICENCATELPPDAANAMICSFECTFCRSCVESVLMNVCPNCGGGFEARPVRPAKEWVAGCTVAVFAPVGTRVHKPVDARAHAEFAAPLRALPPNER
jgi:hypothetical protein